MTTGRNIHSKFGACVAALSMAILSACFSLAVTPETYYVRSGSSADRKQLAELHAQAVWGAPSADSTFAVGVSLPAVTFNTGEPVQLLVTTTNRSLGMQMVDTGYRGNFIPSLDIVVIQPDRKLAALRNPSRIDNPSGRANGRGVFLNEHGCQDFEVDLNKMFDLSMPGQYLAYAKRAVDGGEVVSGNLMFVIAPSSNAPVASASVPAATSGLPSGGHAGSAATLASPASRPPSPGTGTLAQSVPGALPASEAALKPPPRQNRLPGASPAPTLVAISPAFNSNVGHLGLGLAALCAAVIALILIRALRRKRPTPG